MKAPEREQAFTLAEVLITLGIIGIVAAMTMPTLIQKHREHVRVVQVKKAYSLLQQALLKAIVNHGEVKYWDLAKTQTDEKDENDEYILDNSGREQLLSYLAEGLNIAKPVEYITITKCDINGESCSEKMEPSIQLSDGSIITGWVNDYNVDFAGVSFTFPECLKTKCRKGVDIFSFNITKDNNKVRPVGADDWSRAHRATYCNPKSQSKQNGDHCTAWILEFENMDYLRQ